MKNKSPIEGFCEGVGKADTVEVRGEEVLYIAETISGHTAGEFGGGAGDLGEF